MFFHNIPEALTLAVTAKPVTSSEGDQGVYRRLQGHGDSSLWPKQLAGIFGAGNYLVSRAHGVGIHHEDGVPYLGVTYWDCGTLEHNTLLAPGRVVSAKYANTLVVPLNMRRHGQPVCLQLGERLSCIEAVGGGRLIRLSMEALYFLLALDSVSRACGEHMYTQQESLLRELLDTTEGREAVVQQVSTLLESIPDNVRQLAAEVCSP